MTSAGVTQGNRAASAAIRSLLYRTVLVVALALAPALTPYLLTPAFALQSKVTPMHAGPHTGAHTGHPTPAPDEALHTHPHCLRCVLFASSLPVKVVLTPSTPLVEELLRLEVVLMPRPQPNPNVGARAPPAMAQHS